MKFARLLRTTAEDLPELQCLFHIYKHLKKQLKQLPARADSKAPGTDQQQQPQGGRGPGQAEVSHVEASEEARFTAVLTDHLQRLNDRFLEREETCVIQLERLEAEAAAAEKVHGVGADLDGEIGSGGTPAAQKAIAEQRAQLYKRFVNFHGEVLLLVHWSVLAYTATVKILKKHHKRTGLLLRAPQLADLLSQPFCSSELMTGLARKAEACIQRLAEQLASSDTSGDGAMTTSYTGTGEAATDGAATDGFGDQQGIVGQAAAPGSSGGAATAAAAAAIAKNTAAAAAAAMAVGSEDSFDVGDGSSPSCSQGMGDLPLRRAASTVEVADLQAAAAEPGCHQRDHVDRDLAAGMAAMPHSPSQDQQQGQPQRRGRRSQPEQRQQLQDDDARAGGMEGGLSNPSGGGAIFLRNLARLSDNNSAASLSGPYVLEQLVELQQYVDEYDKMDEDDPEEKIDIDDEEDDEKDSGAPASVGLGPTAAAERGGGGGCGITAGPSANDTTGSRPGPLAEGGVAGRSQPPVPATQDADARSDQNGTNDGNSQPLFLLQLEGQAQSQPGEAGIEDGLGAAAGSGSGSGQGSAPAAPAAAEVAAAAPPPLPLLPPQQHCGSAGTAGGPAAAAAPTPPTVQQSSSGSAGAAGGAGSISIAISEAFGATRPQGAAANLLRRTQVALTMWEQLRTNASTPSTVLDPAGGQPGLNQGGGEPRSKRPRLLDGHGATRDAAAVPDAAAAAAEGPRHAEAEEIITDDSDSNSD
ncbi:hypothetical protein VaNZ11_003443 [Volvox africanus]|uniref:SPX domain-containing protein n=1 Tax=Volvox africanus TaxID=51714 RepID=A0ABQ5RU60_9CHLO|nr:hypothetical protein VaNZ11_003443 [Volvox africanus]